VGEPDDRPDGSAPVVHQGRNRSTTPPFAGSIRVVSWNIQFGIEVDAAANALVGHPNLRDADIILLQEMDEVGVAHLAGSLALNYVYASPGLHQQSGRHFGNAVLSPWPIGEPDVISLPHKAGVRGQSRLLVKTRVDLGPHVIDAASVHTEVPSMSSTKRLRQYDEIAGVAHRRAGPLIVGGDFNTVTRRGIRALTERMGVVGAVRVSAGAGPTLRRSGKEFALDHIFARGLPGVATGVVHGNDASDHRPLWVVLGSERQIDSGSAA
jgi:endonuclease/exonuclease/phosphatase family metal-dependent hydrolase